MMLDHTQWQFYTLKWAANLRPKHFPVTNTDVQLHTCKVDNCCILELVPTLTQRIMIKHADYTNEVNCAEYLYKSGESVKLLKLADFKKLHELFNVFMIIGILLQSLLQKQCR